MTTHCHAGFISVGVNHEPCPRAPPPLAANFGGHLWRGAPTLQNLTRALRDCVRGRPMPWYTASIITQPAPVEGGMDHEAFEMACLLH
jgi:hypothetical protein